MIAETSNFDLELNYHNHSSPIYDSSLLNQQTEVNNRIKNTIKINHNLNEIELLKIIRDLKRPILAYDTIVGWKKWWNSNNVIFVSNSKIWYDQYEVYSVRPSITKQFHGRWNHHKSIMFWIQTTIAINIACVMIILWIQRILY